MRPVIHSEHIVKSHYPDVRNIPDTDIYSFIFEREKTGNYPPIRSPDRIAFVDAPSGYELSFSKLKETVNSLARGLSHQIGIQEHDVVCFFSKNHV
jgi:long-subunit acyl-CoA synthetase (AMP-forming)